MARIITGLTKALQEAGRADETARSIATRAAHAGLAGIAQNMAHVYQVTEQVRADINAATDEASNVVTSAAGVPSKTTPPQTVAALSALDASLAALHGNLGAILGELSKARQAAITVLRGGRPGPMLAALDAVRATLTTTVGIVNRTRQDVTAAVAQATSLGDPGGGFAAGRATADLTADEQTRIRPMLPVTEGWTRVDAKDTPSHVRDAAADFKPRFDKDPRETVVIYDGDKHVSGGRRQYQTMADDLDSGRILRPDGRPYPHVPDHFVVHPEMRVAATMRKRNLTDAEIVVDNTMCGSRGFDRDDALTCENYLPGAMPVNSRMTVWVTVDGGRTFHRKTIIGTGTLIRR
ncbi:DUF6244 family protein [Virgisporangium aurantiacum]|nr:DUF6244 family protein [Virgisporangium aurantiacum]